MFQQFFLQRVNGGLTEFCRTNLRTMHVFNITHFPCHLHSVIVVMSRVTNRLITSDVLTAVSDEVMYDTIKLVDIEFLVCSTRKSHTRVIDMTKFFTTLGNWC